MLNSKTMKRIVLLIGVVISVFAVRTVVAQQSGVITYETKQNLHRNLPKEREGMKAMMPEFRTTKNQLFFNESESLYKPIIEDEEEDMVSTPQGGGGGVVMRFQMPNQEVYFHAGEQMAFTSQEFNGKQYRIMDSTTTAPWKFGTETKMILGYECKQAFYTTTETVNAVKVTGSGPPEIEKRTITREITAWYTDKIRFSLGPDKFYSLPGTVLAIDINNGERVTVATKIDLRALKKNELKMPEKGDKISQGEFRKMRDEQMQKMRQGGGGFMIRN
jgi:GLPGLI family protein